MANPVKITDGTRFATIDKVTHALNTIDYAHHEMHAGATYRASIAGTAIGNTNTLSIEILTPAAGGKQMHFTGAVTTENAADLVFQELIEVSANGAALTPRNANRNFGDGSTVQATLKNSTVVTTNAVVLDSRHIGTASPSPSRPGVGGGAESRGEWVLRENTWYQLILTNIAGAAQDMHMAVEWYEHTPKG